MSQRRPVDRQAFEQFLAAACFLHQLRQEPSRRTSDSPHYIDDIYVPGIGVRAALDDDVSEASSIWPAVRQKCEGMTQSARQGLARASAGAKHAAAPTLKGLRNLRGKLRKVPVPPTWRRVSDPSGLIEDRPPQDSHACPYVVRAQSVLIGAWRNIPFRLRQISRYRPKLLAVLRWADNPRYGRSSSSLPNSRTVPRGMAPGLRYRLDLKGLCRDGPVWAVLLVILLFLVIEMGTHDSSRYTGATSLGTAQATTVPRKPTVASDAGLSKPQAGLRKLQPAGKMTTRSAHRRRKQTVPINSAAK
jgi:hypothetical protein